jgi:hypothetical protein
VLRALFECFVPSWIALLVARIRFELLSACFVLPTARVYGDFGLGSTKKQRYESDRQPLGFVPEIDARAIDRFRASMASCQVVSSVVVSTDGVCVVIVVVAVVTAAVGFGGGVHPTKALL